MQITLSRDESGKFVPASQAELDNALIHRVDIDKKRNSPNNIQSVLQTTLQGMNEAQDVCLEDMGL